MMRFTTSSMVFGSVAITRANLAIASACFFRFSFGAWVASRVACELPEVSAIFLIGTPINKYDFGYLRTCERPILFLHGTEDEHGSVEKLEKLVLQVRNAESVIVTGADHFFTKQLDTVDETIRTWAEEVTQSS